MKKRLVLILFILTLVLSSCYFPIHDENGKQIEVTN